MAILIFDERSTELYVRCRPGETITPDDEANQLASEVSALRAEHMAVAKKLSLVLARCTEWNKKHDAKFAESLAKREKVNRLEAVKPEAPGTTAQ